MTIKSLRSFPANFKIVSADLPNSTAHRGTHQSRTDGAMSLCSSVSKKVESSPLVQVLLESGACTWQSETCAPNSCARDSAYMAVERAFIPKSVASSICSNRNDVPVNGFAAFGTVSTGITVDRKI